jgi:hypothetical protein
MKMDSSILVWPGVFNIFGFLLQVAIIVRIAQLLGEKLMGKSK